HPHQLLARRGQGRRGTAADAPARALSVQQCRVTSGRSGCESGPAPCRLHARMARLIDLLLTTDRHQRLRLAQSALASLLMFASVAVMPLMTAAGLNDGRWLWPWTAASVLGLLIVFALIRSGWSLRLGDPSMTMAQMLYSIACAASGYAIAGAGHGAVPLIL